MKKNLAEKGALFSKRAVISLENVFPLNPAEEFNESIDHTDSWSASFYDILGIYF